MKGQDGADELAKEALDTGVAPTNILSDALVPAMDRVGQKFSENKIFVPQMLMSAKAMGAAMNHLKPFFQSGDVKTKGTFIIGTVKGDLHDIGKNLVRMMMEGKGIDVVDIGICPTPTVQFTVKELKANGGIAISASHNPNEWNALKLLNDKGEFMTLEENKEMLGYIDGDKFHYEPWDKLGKLTDYSEGGLIVKQRVAAGLGDITVIASGGNSHQSFIDLGGEGAEGVLFLNYFDADYPNDLVQEFVTKYVALYDEKPATEIAPYGYEAPYIYKAAIEKGATRATFSEVLSTIKYVGVTGTTEFGPDNDVLNKGQFILIIQDGMFTSYVP